MLSRPVAGLACKIRMSLRHYEAVAVVATDESHSVRLMHRDPGLCIDLVSYSDFAAAEDHCDRLADFLQLPPMMLAGRGASLGETAAEATPAPRRGNPVRTRKPRFLTRRRMGEVVAIRKINGHELIGRH